MDQGDGEVEIGCLTSRWRCADASPLRYPNPWGSTSKNPPSTHDPAP